MTVPIPGNFQTITSPDQFKELLQKDLERLSLINFWAPWAEPCKQMNEVTLECAKKYPSLLVLQVDAEDQTDISESFEVESVPTFVVLRGHTLLGRVAGADADALTALLSKHTSTPSSVAPQSHTEKAPAPAETEKAEEKVETQEELDSRLRGLMNKSTVVLFMKGSPDEPRCGFSRKMVGLLRDHGTEFTHFDILSDESVRSGLKVLNDWPTFPQLIIKGEFVGGLDIVQEMVENGEYKELLQDA